MSSKIEDDYWNATSGSSFRFDDEGESTQESLHETFGDEQDSIFNSTLEANSVLPLHSIISRKNLDSVLNDIKIPKPLTVPPVADPIKDMFLGNESNLYCYRTLDEKLALLDKAVESYDGNIILKVVLFLSKTLKPSIIYRYLTKRPLALQQYANYLTNSNRTHDLELLYTATGNKSYLSNLFYLTSKKTSINTIHKKLNQFSVEYLDNLKDDYEKTIFNYHKKFIQYKLDNNLQGDTPIVVLAELYNKKLDRGDPHTDTVVLDYIKLLKISEFQSEWVLMNVIAAKEMWPKLNELFIKSNWFTKKNVIKSNINLEVLITGLSKHEIPDSIIDEFLTSISDVDRSLLLGMKLKCHRFVIETLIARRDRIGLLEYRSQLTPQSEFIVTIESALKSHVGCLNYRVSNNGCGLIGRQPNPHFGTTENIKRKSLRFAFSFA